VPWYGSGGATYLHLPDAGSDLPAGFIQARKHPARPEASIDYLAPGMKHHTRADDVARKLLKHLIRQAGDFGIQRLYTCLPTQTEITRVVAGSGFALYVRETLFRLNLPRRTENLPVARHVRPQHALDSVALQRLSDRHTPPVVQKAEGVASQDNHGPDHTTIFQTWWPPVGLTGLVYVKDEAIVGAVRMRSGRSGHWLHFVGDVTKHAIMRALLIAVLRTLPQDDLPIYCGVRGYQSALGPILVDSGFEIVTELARFVKHTTVSIKKTVPAASRLLAEPSLGAQMAVPTPATNVKQHLIREE